MRPTIVGATNLPAPPAPPATCRRQSMGRGRAPRSAHPGTSWPPGGPGLHRVQGAATGWRWAPAGRALRSAACGASKGAVRHALPPPPPLPPQRLPTRPVLRQLLSCLQAQEGLQHTRRRHRPPKRVLPSEREAGTSARMRRQPGAAAQPPVSAATAAPGLSGVVCRLAHGSLTMNASLTAFSRSCGGSTGLTPGSSPLSGSAATARTGCSVPVRCAGGHRRRCCSSRGAATAPGGEAPLLHVGRRRQPRSRPRAPMHAALRMPEPTCGGPMPLWPGRGALQRGRGESAGLHAPPAPPMHERVVETRGMAISGLGSAGGRHRAAELAAAKKQPKALAAPEGRDQ